MNLIDILVIIGCVLIILTTVILAIVNKKKGKTSCGCDCSKCAGCKNKSTCKSNEIEKE